MKLSEYYDKPSNDVANRPQKTQILAYNNEAKEAQMEAKIANLEAEMTHFRAIEEEKSVISGQLQLQHEENGVLLQTIAENNARIADFEAQMQEKQRLMDEVDVLQRSNTNLSNLQGEAHARLSELRNEYATNSSELAQLRINNADLEIGKQTLYNETVQKDTLLQELSTALGDLKEQHEGLASFSDELGRRYAEISDERDNLDKTALKTHGELLILKKQHDDLTNQLRLDKNQAEQAVEQRIRGQMNKQTEELQQDVKELVNLNKLYKNELSKPQHTSIGAIARQEGFKMPLASSAINYRKNNLGTGKPTLLKFGGKEKSE
tara:strand:- start:1492 stop:2457 length:966 start_codon:yes stop_codon:yes gene_type:complete